MSRGGCPMMRRILQSVGEQRARQEEYNGMTAGRSAYLESQFPMRATVRLTFDEDDLFCLSDGQWLNDQIINSYLALLASRSENNIGFTNSFFMKKLERDGADQAACWQGIKGQPIYRYDKFIVPVQHGCHWILACFDFISGELMIFDGFHQRYDDVAESLNSFLEYQGAERLSVVYPRCPSQLNGDDCGVFLLKFAECLFFDYTLDSFSQQHMPSIRRRIRRELREAV